jgi:hypothetical protein
MNKLMNIILVALVAPNGDLLSQGLPAYQEIASPSAFAGARFGHAVATVGNNILVGAPGDTVGTHDPGTGAAYLFDGDTLQKLLTFESPSSSGPDSFGYAVAGVGNFAIVSAPEAGAVYVFDATDGTPLGGVFNTSRPDSDRFGFAVSGFSIDANANGVVEFNELRIVVGAPLADYSAINDGAVYLFNPSLASVIPILNPTPAPYDFFGFSVAALGTDILVGAPSNDNASLPDAGAVYVFSSDGAPLDTLLGFTSDEGFGFSIAAAGDDFVIGASSLTVHFFEGSTRQFQHSFPSPNYGTFDDRFGYALTGTDENVYISAPGGDSSIDGDVFVFAKDSEVASARLDNPTGDPTHRFGHAVGALDNFVLASAPNAGPGVVYVMSIPPSCKRLDILSPRSSEQICGDSVQVEATFEIVNGTPPFTIAGDVNGVPATLTGNTLTAVIPLSPGNNNITVRCTITDATSQSVECTRTIDVGVISPFHKVVLNEILHNPNYDDFDDERNSGTERIEIKNLDTVAVSLARFALWVRRDTLNTYWAFPDTAILPANGLMVIHWLAQGVNESGNLFTGLPSTGPILIKALETQIVDNGFWGDNDGDPNAMQLGGPANGAFALALVKGTTVGLTTAFNNPCNLVDFVQINGRVSVIEDIAVQAGLWTVGDFINKDDLPDDGFSYEYRGTNQSGSDLTMSGDFFRQPSPSIGFENTLQASPDKHLLISEVCVRPRSAEFIEIYNPGPDTLSLADYYLTDNVNSNDNSYTRLTMGMGSLNIANGDFFVRFPANAKIAPREYQTIAFDASLFRFRYSQAPTYEINRADGNPANDMRRVKPDTLTPFVDPNLADPNEVVLLLKWDGESDLVQDVDYVVWGALLSVPKPNLSGLVDAGEVPGSVVAAGPLNEAVDKTGLSLDGLDLDAVKSYYDNETSLSDQKPVAGQTHAFLKSWQRRVSFTDFAPIEFGEITVGGNGVSGHDETSEDLAAAFEETAPATPSAARSGLRLEFVDAVAFDTLRTGNADNILNPGEDIRLKVRLTNKGQAPTGPLFSIIRFFSPFDSLVVLSDDSTATYPSIASGDTVESIDFYAFAMAHKILPDTIRYVLLVIDKQSGQPVFLQSRKQPTPTMVEMTIVPGQSQADSPLPAMQVSNMVMSVRESHLLAFIKLDNVGCTDGVDIRATLSIDGIGNASTPVFFGTIEFEHCGGSTSDGCAGRGRCEDEISCLSGSPCSSLLEKPFHIAFDSRQDIGLLETFDILNVRLNLQSGPDSGVPAQVDELVVPWQIPRVSVSVEYPKSRVLVPGVTMNLMASAMDPSSSCSGASVPIGDPVDTGFHGYAEFAKPLFEDAETETPQCFKIQIGLPGFDELFAQAIDCADQKLCEMVFTDGNDGTPSPDEILLGNVISQSGDPADMFNLSDCAAIGDFVSGNRDPQIVGSTGQWRAKLLGGNLGPGNVLDLGPGSLLTTNRFYNIKVYMLGDLDASWRPLTPSVYCLNPALSFACPDPTFCSDTDASVDNLLTGNQAPSSALPQTVELFQSYPNPLSAAASADDATTIRFALPKPETVSIKIYDVLGRLVKTLQQQNLPAGYHRLFWRGDDQSGARVGAGVYFVRLQAGKVATTKRLLLLR